MPVWVRAIVRFGVKAASAWTLFAACAPRDVNGEASLPAGTGAHGTEPAASASEPPQASKAPAPAAPASTDPPPPAPPPSGPLVVATNEALSVGAEMRSYVLVSPREIDPARRYPLVLAMHGDGGDGASMRAMTKLDDASGKDAFVVYPSGRNHTWDLYTPVDSDLDVAFLESLVASLAARFPIDPARVFATGFSSGAFMANQMACRRPSLLRAIASHGGGAPAEPQDATATTWDGGYVRCAGQTTGVAALVVHGKDDGVVAWESGDYTARYWAAVNGCAGTRSPASGVLGAAGCMKHDACPAPTQVVFCSKPGLGHDFAPDAAAVTWAFFASL